LKKKDQKWEDVLLRGKLLISMDPDIYYYGKPRAKRIVSSMSTKSFLTHTYEESNIEEKLNRIDKKIDRSSVIKESINRSKIEAALEDKRRGKNAIKIASLISSNQLKERLKKIIEKFNSHKQKVLIQSEHDNQSKRIIYSGRAKPV